MTWGSRLARVGLALTALGLVAGLASKRAVSLVRWRETPAREQAATSTGEIGTEAPFAVLDADDQERWVALCQAREDTDKDGVLSLYAERSKYLLGDLEGTYLVTGQGPGEKVGTFLRADASGRHIAFLRGHDWTVRDVDTRREFSLRRDYIELPYRSYAPLLISFGGGFVLASTLNSSWAYATLVELRWGISSQVDFGPGKIWSLAVDSTGRWARAEVAADAAPLTEAAWQELIMSGQSCVTPGHAERFPAKYLTLEERWMDLWTGRLVPAPPASLSWPERSSRRDIDRQPVSQTHVLRADRSPAHVRRLLERSWLKGHENPLPEGPLRWQSPPHDPSTRRAQRRAARTTVRQGDCAVYAPLTVTADASPFLTPARPRDDAKELIITLQRGSPPHVLRTAQDQMAQHYEGFWRDLSVGTSWPPGTTRQGATTVLVGHARGQRYETTVEQLTDEFVREAGDEPLAGDWPLYRGWIGFLNSIARHEDLPMRFVLSQYMEDGSLHVTGVSAVDVCGQVALDP